MRQSGEVGRDLVFVHRAVTQQQTLGGRRLAHVVQRQRTGHYPAARDTLHHRLIIDHPGERSITARLQANHKHDIRLEFYENGGAAACQLSWSGPGVPKAIIPTERLYPRDVHTVHLDSSYPKWLADGWAVMSIPNYEEVYRIRTAEDDARADFTISATATRLTLNGENLRDTFNDHVRSTTAFGQSEPLDWSRRPLSGFLQGHLIELADEKLRSPCRTALASLLDHWDGLTLFVNDARIPLDNNYGERLIRDPAVGRKNYYGSGSEWSGRLAMRLFSIFATLKLWNINPRRWLMLYLEACANSGGKAPTDVSEFLPWNMPPDRLSELQNSTIDQRQMDTS